MIGHASCTAQITGSMVYKHRLGAVEHEESMNEGQS